jgi:hypothetical protein
VADPLDARIDELYRLPLSEFTPARNALATSIGGADRQRVRRLAKPTVVPWAINQLYWRARKLYDRLLETGEALRTAQIGALKGKRNDVRAASDAHRAALAAAVAEAARIAEAGGARPGAEALSRMLEALSLAPTRPEPPGRLTEVLQPAGFEALLGVTPVARVEPPPQPVGRAAARTGKPSSERHADRATEGREPLRRAEAAREARARLAEAALRRRQDRTRRREQAAAERARAAAKNEAAKHLARVEKQHAAARKAFERARARLSEAERAVADAKARMRELE